ncbi:MAG TPA: MarR family transcriptional regulator [Cellvibrionaceae bacterium]
MTHRADSDALLFNNLTFWINRLAASMKDSANTAFAAHNITWPQWMTLNVLDSGAATTPAEIADTIGIDRSAITRLLDRLADKDYIRRIHDDGDRRKVKVALTENGQAKMQELNALAEQQQQFFLSQLPPTELRVFKGHLQKLLRAGGQETKHLWRNIG